MSSSTSTTGDSSSSSQGATLLLLGRELRRAAIRSNTALGVNWAWKYQTYSVCNWLCYNLQYHNIPLTPGSVSRWTLTCLNQETDESMNHLGIQHHFLTQVQYWPGLRFFNNHFLASSTLPVNHFLASSTLPVNYLWQLLHNKCYLLVCL